MKVARLTAASAHHLLDSWRPDPADSLFVDTVLADTVLADTVLADPLLADPLLADPLLADTVLVLSPACLMYAVPVCRSYTLYRYVVHHDLYGV
jgi:hypothetical protein